MAGTDFPGFSFGFERSLPDFERSGSPMFFTNSVNRGGWSVDRSSREEGGFRRTIQNRTIDEMDRLFFLKINAIKRGWSEGFCICDIVTGNESICCPVWKPGDDDCGFFFFFLARRTISSNSAVPRFSRLWIRVIDWVAKRVVLLLETYSCRVILRWKSGSSFFFQD